MALARKTVRRFRFRFFLVGSHPDRDSRIFMLTINLNSDPLRGFRPLISGVFYGQLGNTTIDVNNIGTGPPGEPQGQTAVPSR